MIKHLVTLGRKTFHLTGKKTSARNQFEGGATMGWG